MHNHIKTLRTSANISQEQMANMLGMTRITYTHIESGKREPKPSELQKIADFFETSVEKILDHSQKSPVVLNSTLEHTKLTETILYVLSKCAGKANFGKIALNKLLYFIDFNYHEKYHTSLTGASYIKMPM